MLPVTATADNCLLTCYPFLAQHRTDHQIVCEQGVTLKGRRTASRESMNVGEAVLVPCDDPARSSSRATTTATSSNFEISTSSYEDSSQSVTGMSYYLLILLLLLLNLLLVRISNRILLIQSKYLLLDVYVYQPCT